MSDFEVRGFESTEEMFDWMRRQEAAANQQVTPEQAEIGFDAYWMRPFDDFIIFGHIPTPEAIEASERSLGATEEELDYTMEAIKEAHDRGYRYGQAYSEVEPEGEWGSTHISTMVQITKDQFEAAKGHQWEGEALYNDPATHPWFVAAIQKWMHG